MLQQARDEAHRFAVTFQRQRRAAIGDAVLVCAPGAREPRVPVIGDDPAVENGDRGGAQVRVERAAGELRIPFTTGILVGIGETRAERVETLVRSHHGSLARPQRMEVEDRLKAGLIKGLVATSSLELGIDMGAIDLVIQIEAPPTR